MSQREDLLAGARKCLIEKGYSRTTARDIAAASGAHLASIGYHFGSKDRLMSTAVLEATSEWGDTLEAAVREVDADSPSGRLEALLTTLFEAIRRSRELHVASVQALAQAQFDDEILAALAEGFREGRAALAAMLLGTGTADVSPGEAASLGSAVHALVTGYIVQSLIDPDSMPAPGAVAESLRALAGSEEA